MAASCGWSSPRATPNGARPSATCATAWACAPSPAPSSPRPPRRWPTATPRRPGRQFHRRTQLALQARHSRLRREKPARPWRPEFHRGRAGRHADRPRVRTCKTFKVITREFLNQQAVVQVTDEFELANCLHALFSSDEIRRELGARAKATFEANLGAAQRTAEVIIRSLGTKATAFRDSGRGKTVNRLAAQACFAELAEPAGNRTRPFATWSKASRRNRAPSRKNPPACCNG